MDDNGAPRMEMRALLAIVLSMMVLTLYQYFFVPAPEELPPIPEAVQQPIPAAAPATPAGEPIPGSAPAGPAVEAVAGEAAAAEPDLVATAPQRVTVRGNLYEAVVTNRGGVLESFILSGFDELDGGALNLVHPLASAAGILPLRLDTPGDPGLAAAANAALHVVDIAGGRFEGDAHVPLPGDPVRVTLRWRVEGVGVTKTLTFADAGYQVGLDVDTSSPVPAYVALGPGLNYVDPSSSNTFLCECAPIYGPDGVDHLAADDLEAPLELAGNLRWAGVESHYFLGAFLLDRPASARAYRESLPDPGATVEAGAPVTHDLLSVALDVEGSVSTTLYLGPKKYDLLTTQGYGLEEVVAFGFFGIVGRPLLTLLNWIDGYVANYGVAIILLTALLRLVFLPLNHRAMVSMRRTQKLQPQMAAIRAKYKGAKEIEKRQKMNEEVMELYRREGVSPFGGCLPMLAQMPILFAFYSLLSVAVELRGAPFMLWIHDLSKHDPYLVLPLLMGGSMVVQQRMTPTAGINPAQARMMNLMPIMFTVLFLYVPSGLVLYWLVNNLLGIAQQIYVTRRIDGAAPEAKAPKRGGKGQRGNK